MDSDSNKGRLLSEEEDLWGNWSSDWHGNRNNRSQNSSDWGNGSPEKRLVDNQDKEEDELEKWLNDETTTTVTQKKKKQKDEWDDWKTEPSSKTSSRSSNSKNKSSTQENSEWTNVEWDSGFTSSAKQKQPLVGNLVDLGSDDTKGNSNSGWENDTWADDDDEWQSLEIDSTSNKKK